MSYENAYIPLTNGLNLICGPNGAGKSSILLGISIVLGQSYTERAKKLSELIRWGQDEAKVTLILNNKLEDGRRLFPQFKNESIEVARVIRKNGDYNYFIQGKRFSKNEISSTFRKIGLNPDNMLIIMHQLMVGKFSLTNPQEKLKMLEEAVGFQSYRENVLTAVKRLSEFKSEEEKLLNSLDSAKATYEFWRREYEKLLKKQELNLRLNEVNKKIAWLKVKRKKEELLNLLKRINELKSQKINVENDIKSFLEKIDFEALKYNERLNEKTFREEELLRLFKNEAELNAKLKLLNILLEKFPLEASKIASKIFDEKLTGNNIYELKIKLEEGLQGSKAFIEECKLKLKNLNELINESQLNLIDFKVNLEVEKRKIEMLNQEIEKAEMLRLVEEEELKKFLNEAEKLGLEVNVEKRFPELLLEKKIIEEQLKIYSNISENVEEVYESYAKLFEKLKSKAEEVLRNKEMVQKELKYREKSWANVLKSFLKKLSEDYNFILSFLGGKGEVKLINEDNIEKAGLEISVGFKGRSPKPLDSLTQSGGERSIALIAFLLALQRNVSAPFRAIDEFDVHMDPKNREAITELIISSWKSCKEQYLVITPGEVHVPNNDVHVIVVQSVKGLSKVSELKRNES